MPQPHISQPSPFKLRRPNPSSGTRQEPASFNDQNDAAAAIETSSLAQEIEQEVAQEIAAERSLTETAGEVAQAVSVAAAYFEDTLQTPPSAIHAAGTLGAATLAALLGACARRPARRAGDAALGDAGRRCNLGRLARRSSAGLAGGSAGGAGQLMRIAINLATRPFVELRPLFARLRLAMAALALTAIALGIGLHMLNTTARAAQAQMDSLKAQTLAVQIERQTNEARMRQPQNRAVLDRSIFLNDLFARKSFSWTAVMMDLERVLPAGVQVTSIEPAITAEGNVNIRLRVSGQRDLAVDLVRNLEHSQRFLAPHLNNETAQIAGANGLQPVVRYRRSRRRGVRYSERLQPIARSGEGPSSRNNDRCGAESRGEPGQAGRIRSVHKPSDNQCLRVHKPPSRPISLRRLPRIRKDRQARRQRGCPMSALTAMKSKVSKGTVLAQARAL